MSAYGAGCPPAKVTLTDSVRGLDTLPVPEANPSAVSLTVAVTFVPSWTMSMASGLSEIPENVTFQRPVTVRIDTGNVVETAVALLSVIVAVAVSYVTSAYFTPVPEPADSAPDPAAPPPPVS